MFTEIILIKHLVVIKKQKQKIVIDLTFFEKILESAET